MAAQVPQLHLSACPGPAPAAATAAHTSTQQMRPDLEARLPRSAAQAVGLPVGISQWQRAADGSI